MAQTPGYSGNWPRRDPGPVDYNETRHMMSVDVDVNEVYITGQVAFDEGKTQIATWRYLSDGSVASGWPKLWPENPDGQSYGVVALVENSGAVFVVGSYMPEGTSTPNTVVLKYLDDGTLHFASEFNTVGQCGWNVPVAAALSGAGSIWVAASSIGCEASNFSVDYLIWAWTRTMGPRSTSRATTRRRECRSQSMPVGSTADGRIHVTENSEGALE